MVLSKNPLTVTLSYSGHQKRKRDKHSIKSHPFFRTAIRFQVAGLEGLVGLFLEAFLMSFSAQCLALSVSPCIRGPFFPTT